MTPTAIFDVSVHRHENAASHLKIWFAFIQRDSFCTELSKGELFIM